MRTFELLFLRRGIRGIGHLLRSQGWMGCFGLWMIVYRSQFLCFLSWSCFRLLWKTRNISSRWCWGFCFTRYRHISSFSCLFGDLFLNFSRRRWGFLFNYSCWYFWCKVALFLNAILVDDFLWLWDFIGWFGKRRRSSFSWTRRRRWDSLHWHCYVLLLEHDTKRTAVENGQKTPSQ